jgi:hypothetical protein
VDGNANAVFFPWVRRGAAAAIPIVDTLAAGQRGAADLSTTLSINGAPGAPFPIRLRGPADVVGIDPHEIVRMDPRPGSADFEPNYFPAIEFDRPDFPWLFTPARADASGRLRPWLCLVVVCVRDGVSVTSSADAPLPALEIGPRAVPRDELPDLSESHLWAHGQAASAASATAAELSATLGGDPALSLSRLLCPRVLTPRTDYIACVVPTFEVGRKVGLGLDVTEQELTGPAGLAPAWSLTPAPSVVRVPVYHQWRFRTGEGGDFESLVRLLKPRPAPSGLGRRPIAIGQPGFRLPSTFPADATLALGGALRPMGPIEGESWPKDTQTPFQTELAKILNAPASAQAVDASSDPLLAPPLYGQWHVARTSATPGGSAWFDELNLDPRHRSVAAFGTRVVQEHQEALMAAAWEQAADLQRVNQQLRQLQLGLVVSVSFHGRHFKALNDEGVLRVGGPAFARLRGGGPMAPAETLVARLNASAVPVRAASPAMRRIARERGPITRRVAAQGATRSGSLMWIAKLNSGGGEFVGLPWMDLANVESIRQHLPQPSSVLPYREVNEPLIAATGGRPRFEIVAEGQPLRVQPGGPRPTSLDSPPAAVFRAAASTHLARVDPSRFGVMFGPPPPLPMNEVREGLLAQIDPVRTFTALARAVVTTGPNATQPVAVTSTALNTTAPAMPIEPIMAAPKFTQPMYEALRDLSQELLLPGLESVLPNSVLGLVTNRRFVEAYMVGLNVEMGRELLWRGFPTDQRGTCFDRFWDTRGAAVPRPDVRPLHEWGTGPLGSAQTTSDGEQFVMLLRSDLLRRYPTTVIYATRARVSTDGVRTLSPDPADEVYPSFRGSMSPDVSFFGFDLSIHQVRGHDPGPGRHRSPGYFIVIQEQPTEPRFGYDEGTPFSGTHVRVSDGPPPGTTLNGLTWGHNAAHMAGIVRQQPVRVAIHASQFVTQT